MIIVFGSVFVMKIDFITFTLPFWKELRELVKQFEYVLHYASAELPLVVMIDSLDQLDPANNARNLFWLPQQLPPHVKFVVSTLEEDVYECFPNLQVYGSGVLV
jgi:hypothetical protein